MMHLLRCLFFISEYHHFLVEAVHLPGKINIACLVTIFLRYSSPGDTSTANTSPRIGSAATGT